MDVATLIKVLNCGVQSATIYSIWMNIILGSTSLLIMEIMVMLPSMELILIQDLMGDDLLSWEMCEYIHRTCVTVNSIL